MKLTQPSVYEHICVYGEPKTGKSTLISELTAHGWKLLWISMDNGHNILYKLPPAQQAMIELVVLPDTTLNPIAYTTIRRLITGLPYQVCDAHGIIDCATCKKNEASFTRVCLGDVPSDTIVVFDPISQLMDSATAVIYKRRTAKMQSAEAKDDYKFDWDDWRTLGVLMNEFMTFVQNAKFNLVCVTHTVESKQEDGTAKLTPQIGTGNYSIQSSKFFDDVVYCHMFNKSHRVGSSTTYNTNAIAGSRIDVCIEKMEKPSLAPFFGSVKAKEIVKEVNNETRKNLEGSKTTVTETTVVAVDSKEVTTEIQKEEVLSKPVVQEMTAAEKTKAMLAKLKGGK